MRCTASVLTPRDHPLLAVRRLTLQDARALSDHHLRRAGARALEARGVVRGAGPRAADRAERDRHRRDQGVRRSRARHRDRREARLRAGARPRLRAIDASHLFEPNTIHLGVRRNDYLRGYVLDFIEMFAPQLTRTRVETRLRKLR